MLAKRLAKNWQGGSGRGNKSRDGRKGGGRGGGGGKGRGGKGGGAGMVTIKSNKSYLIDRE